MSLYMPQNRGVISNEQTVARGAVISAEGQALVRTAGDQTAGVLPSTGTSSDIFVGFSIAGTVGIAIRESFYNKVDSIVVPVTGVVKLERAPVAGQVGIYDVTEGEGVPVDGTSVTVVGDTISGLTGGNTVRITYKFALTAGEAMSLFGNVNPGGYVGDLVDQIGVIEKGTVWTSEFNAAVDWTKATAVKLGANGQITDQSGTGTVIPRATIVSAPSTNVPYLAIHLS